MVENQLYSKQLLNAALQIVEEKNMMKLNMRHFAQFATAISIIQVMTSFVEIVGQNYIGLLNGR